jgi:hypothetical protein
VGPGTLVAAIEIVYATLPSTTTSLTPVIVTGMVDSCRRDRELKSRRGRSPARRGRCRRSC